MDNSDRTLVVDLHLDSARLVDPDVLRSPLIVVAVLLDKPRAHAHAYSFAAGLRGLEGSELE